MSAPQWKPGDVLLVRKPGGEQCRAFVGGFSTEPTTVVGEWKGDPEVVRRLVVIDPEDSEQVERLTGALAAHGANANDRNYWRETQTALRSLVADPRPDEPQGLGAVVEDAKGRKWVRSLPDGGPAKWLLVTFEPIERTYVWSAIPAVRVLSEGWSA